MMTRRSHRRQLVHMKMVYHAQDKGRRHRPYVNLDLLIIVCALDISVTSARDHFFTVGSFECQMQKPWGFLSRVKAAARVALPRVRTMLAVTSHDLRLRVAKRKYVGRKTFSRCNFWLLQTCCKATSKSQQGATPHYKDWGSTSLVQITSPWGRWRHRGGSCGRASLTAAAGSEHMVPFPITDGPSGISVDCGMTIWEVIPIHSCLKLPITRIFS